MRLLTSLAVITVVTATPGLAQRPIQTFGPAPWQMSPEYRAVQRNALETQRRLLLSMADSMPENLYRDKVTPPQRSFAEQLVHVAQAGPFLLRNFSGVPADAPAPPRGDTAVVLNTRAGLRNYIIATYDWMVWVLDHQTAEDRQTVVAFIGGAQMPRWQVWDELNQHALWTLGQVVANFRKQGMAPPSFLFF